MTAADLVWPEGMNLQPFLDSVHKSITPRKQRLLAVAFARRVAALLPDDRCRSALDVAEEYADRAVRREVLERAAAPVRDACSGIRTALFSRPEDAPRYAIHAAYSATHPLRRRLAPHAADAAAAAMSCTKPLEEWSRSHAAEAHAQMLILRDMYPPRLLSLEPHLRSWNGRTIPGLATAAYADRDFTRLPILADALEEAGCAEADLLDHLRGPGPHTRGCWALELLVDLG